MSGFKQNHLQLGTQPYFIAEIGINHNGHMDLARRMIDASKEAGAAGVKFQKRDLKTLVLSGAKTAEPTGYLSRDERDFPSESKAFGTWTYPDPRLEFTEEQCLDLWRYAEKAGVDFIVSPWEETSVDFLAKNKAKVIKLASIDTTNYQFCEYIAAKGIPTIISTGMTSYSELQIVWSIFEKANCPRMFLHCTSAYPCPIEDKNLSCIPVLQELFGEDVGFSGHGIGFEGTLGAVALGANVIEKHVTLSRAMSGPDQAASLEFDEFAKLVQMSNNMARAVGHPRKSFLASEAVLHGVLSKRIVTKRAVKADESIEPAMIKTVVTYTKTGLLPNEYYKVLGSTARKDLPQNHVLEYEDLRLKV